MDINQTRRWLLGSTAAALAAHPLARAAALVPTPRQSRGPFYPDALPLDTDNDLIQVAGAETTARGTITHVYGLVTDLEGMALPGVQVEIWQCDANGRYRHTGDRGSRPRDPGFQGYGRTVTDGQGRYRFRTIRPVPYPGRAPHIHFAIHYGQGNPLVTQMYVAGDPLNQRDLLLNSVTDPRQRQRLLVPLRLDPAQPSELRGRFDIVLPAIV